MLTQRAQHAGGSLNRMAALAEQWRADAELLARYGSAQLAQVCRQHADEIDAAQRDDDAEMLTLEAAERESGYSRDRLRHMVADGDVPNAGRKGAPRIRRGDLPRKSRAPLRAVGFDVSARAAELVRSGGAR